MGDMEKYLQSTEFFDFNKRRVKEKAFEITKGLKTDKEKAITLFYWVRDEIKYNMSAYYMIKSNFKASVTLRRRYGFCVSKGVLLSTFARAVGIPARIHIADIINHKVSQKIIDFLGTNAMYYHGYSELYLNNKWIKAAPVFDKETAIKVGFLPLVEFDGEQNGMFSQYDNEGKPFVEYIGDRGSYSDLPYYDIERGINEKYKDVIEKYLKKTI